MTTAHVQDPPFAVQVEATEGCNLRCGFCGIRGITSKGPDGGSLPPDGSNHYLTVDLASEFARQIRAADWNPRVEFAMHGEPTLNPKLPEIVAAMRSWLPRQTFMLTTNGIPLLDDWEANLRILFSSGFDTIAVDNYRPYRCEEAFDSVELPAVHKMRYPEDGRAASPHARAPRGVRRLLLIKDLVEAAEGNHSQIFNHAGCAAPRDPNASGRCAKPFRELSMRWDGSFAICCDDWRGELPIGTLDNGIERVWQSDLVNAVRTMLYDGQRVAGPCEGCTHKSTRVGLLPNRMGRGHLEPPTDADLDLIRSSSGRRTGAWLSTPVRRRWEPVEIGS